MESVGYAAAGFVSAQDFLNSAHLSRTACLILDLHMPGIGGLELQRRLAAEHVRTPIIFITADGEPAVSAALRGGAVAVLRKPFKQESLLEALGSALAQLEGPSRDADPG